MIVPSRHQPDLPLDRLILEEKPGDEAIPLDVLFVGAGPAGLAGAIRLAQRVKRDNEQGGNLEVEIGVLEKAETLGEHSLSGAIVNPGPFRELFPDLEPEQLPFRAPVKNERVLWLSEGGARRVPTPREMRNHGNWVASICEIVRFMGDRAEQLGVNLFTGFPAAGLLVEERRVLGVRTAPSGLDRDGNPGSGAMPAADVLARVTVLADGTRSQLAQAFCEWQGIRSQNPQIYALGVKELWEAPGHGLDHVIHTLGWPLPNDAFGGSFVYPMSDELLSLGLVVGLDYKQHSLDVHVLTQKLKQHPAIARYLSGGEMVEWGAKTIPEGGYYALPERFHADGLLLTGDAAGLVNVAGLKGIHYAVQSGIFAADAIFDGLKSGDVSAAKLETYGRQVADSFVREDLWRTRNMRLAFKSGFYRGGFKATLMDLSGGRFPSKAIEAPSDADEEREIVPAADFAPDGKSTFSKQDAVFRSGNATRDDVPSHLDVGSGVGGDVADFYAHLCPAGVYERQNGELLVNPPNCVDCKATDVVGPRWNPREGGSGPRYKRM